MDVNMIIDVTYNFTTLSQQIIWIRFRELSLQKYVFFRTIILNFAQI